MGEDMGIEQQVDGDVAASTDGWAAHTARSLELARTVSMLLFVGAGAAFALGVLASLLTYLSLDTGGSFGEVSTFGSTGSRLALAQSVSILLSSLLPAGLLGAAAVALRLQAGRFEVEVLGAPDAATHPD
jgi:hypothetical protein